MLVEFAPSGGILTSSSIQPLSYSVLCEGFPKCFCVLLFFVITLFYTFDLLLRVELIGLLSILNSVWTILDAIVILLAHFSLSYIVWHTIYVKKVLDVEAQKSEDVFSVDVMCYWNMFFNTGMGTCTFIVWMKTFKYIQLNKTILQFSSTIKKCAKSLFGFIVMFAIVFVAYADLSVLLFGTTHADFRDFSTAMMTMMRMVLGDLYYSEMEEVSPILGPIYFLSYILFVFFILLNMFLAIINDTFSEVKSKIPMNENEAFNEFKKKLLAKLEKIPFTLKMKKTLSSEISMNPLKNDKGGKEKKSTEYTKILNSFFRVMPSQKLARELNELNKRIVVLEKTIDNLLTYLDKTLKANKKSIL